jgi:hypothetical protein
MTHPARLIPFLAAALLPTVAVGAASGADEPVVFAATTWPDLAHARALWAASPFAPLWGQPTFAQARTFVDDNVAMEKSKSGIDMAALGADIAAVREELVFVGGEARVRAAIRCPTVAADTWTKIQTQPALPAGPSWAKFVWSKDGDWLCGAPLFKVGQLAPVLPAEVLAEPPLDAAATAPADCRGYLDLGLLGKTLGNDQCAAVFQRLGLGRATYADRLTATGSDDDGAMPGSRLPLAPLDPAVLARLPPDSILVLGAGIDGPALGAVWKDIAADPHFAKDLAPANLKPAADALGIAIPDLLAGAGGTYVIAVTPGAPFPCVTVIIPSTPAIDGALGHLAALGQLDLSQAQAAPLALPTPPRMPILVQIQHFDHSWVISSDPTIFDRDPAAADGFSLAHLQEGLLPAGARPVAISWHDARQEAKLIATSMTMATAAARQARATPQDNLDAQHMATTVQVLNAVAPKLPVSVALAVQDEKGLRVRARNGIVQLSGGGLLAGMMIPAVTMVRESANKTKSGNNERQIVLCALVWANDHDQNWPPSIAQLLKDNEDLPAKVLVSPGAPEIKDPYCYVRPTTTSPANQPVIVEDPRCHAGHGSMVCYADGHVGWVEGTDLYATAQRLAALPAAAKAGIGPADWGLHDDNPPAPDQGPAMPPGAGNPP